MIGQQDLQINGIRLVYLVPIAGVFFSFIVYFTSHLNQPPKYFIVFNILGVI